MKKIRLTFFFSLFILLNSLGQNLDKNNVDKVILKNEQDIEIINSKISHLESSNKELNRRLKEKDKEFHLYEVLLQKYENSDSSFMTEFSIFIAVFSILLGLIGYFTILIPARKSNNEVDRLLEKLQSNIDSLFSEYLNDNRNKLIIKYIDVLINKNEPETSNAIHYLNSVKHEGFNSQQLFNMRKIVLEDDYEYGYQIFTNMIFTKNEIVEDTAIEIIKNNKNKLIAFSLIYFAQHKVHKYDKIVVDYLNKNPQEWGIKIASIRSASEDYLIKLWDENFKNIEQASLVRIFDTLKYYKKNKSQDNSYNEFISKVKSSNFGKNYKEDELKELFV